MAVLRRWPRAHAARTLDSQTSLFCFSYRHRWSNVYFGGSVLKELATFQSCALDLAFATFIRTAAAAFLDIVNTSGSDLQSLGVALSQQEQLWKQMRVPLIVKSVGLLLKTIGSLK